MLKNSVEHTMKFLSFVLIEKLFYGEIWNNKDKIGKLVFDEEKPPRIRKAMDSNLAIKLRK